MQISFEENSENIIFKINNYGSENKKIFENCYYVFKDDAYIKSFPKSTPNIEMIKSNYSRYSETMFKQLGYFEPVLWEKALLAFIDKVQGKGINWWLTGSCALCLRGIPIQPHDVDIMLDSKDIETINNIFIDNIVEPILDSNGWVVKYFGVLFLHARIDLAFDPEGFVDNPEPVDFGPYAMKKLEEILWQGINIKIPPLKLQLEVNKRRGRIDRVQAIEKFISEQ